MSQSSGTPCSQFHDHDGLLQGPNHCKPALQPTSVQRFVIVLSKWNIWCSPFDAHDVWGLYQGYGIAVDGIFLYRSLRMGGSYDAIKKVRHQNMAWTEKLVAAQFVSLAIGTVCYPIDSVRRQLMRQAGRENQTYWRGGGSGVVAPLVSKLCRIYRHMSQSSETPCPVCVSNYPARRRISRILSWILSQRFRNIDSTGLRTVWNTRRH